MISSVHWNFTWQRHQELASGLAGNGFQVYFVRPLPARGWPGWQRAWQYVHGQLLGRSRPESLRQPVPAGVTPIMPRGLPERGRLAVWLNRRFLMPRMAADLRARGIQRPLIVIHYFPLPYALALARDLKPDLSIYDCVLDFSSSQALRGAPLVEQELVNEVDLVCADSPWLVQRMRALHPRVTELLPAVNPDQYDSASAVAPSHLRNEPPLCAYFGYVGDHLDLELLRRVSERYRLRIIGPSSQPLEGFSPSTEIRGAVPHDRLAEQLRNVDVLLLPYGTQTAMRGVMPAKTFECLATGKPTVVIGLSSLERYRELFYLCATREEFLKAIELSKDEDPALRAARIECARLNSWPARNAQLLDLIESGLRATGNSA